MCKIYMIIKFPFYILINVEEYNIKNVCLPVNYKAVCKVLHKISLEVPIN